ncbi:acetolactate synthase-1/2/3 large subunit [Rhodoligotrophos appendicifer]|uniref:thiamine pyrophosphate-dependent enzyme n=1 Tax=Rhodoligotrophos appendicifer TaxID=987056 RepID=UPI001186A48D|nr:thiamine pyrophosphate-dependent enzyme [Rhodoligotrophos appendicifer]
MTETTGTTMTASHAILTLLSDHGIDRIFMVPGESFLWLLDALNDFPGIDPVTCRHESGAGFMACADGRLTGRPGVLMVSRGPGASNAAIALHTAQQDAVPLLVIVGHVARADVGRRSFQEIDYQSMYGSIAKWVYQIMDPAMIPEVFLKAMRLATTGAPGPVVVVLPEDVQQQSISLPRRAVHATGKIAPTEEQTAEVVQLLRSAQRPLLIAGGALETDSGRTSLLAFAEAWGIPVAVSLRRHDLFPNHHPLFLGHLGHGYPAPLLKVLETSDVILAAGTRLGDITTQGYSFPRMPVADQTLVHCYPDTEVVAWNFAPTVSLACDPASLLDRLTAGRAKAAPDFGPWSTSLRRLFEENNAWPSRQPSDGIEFGQVVRETLDQAKDDLVLCVDGGAFTVPIYRYARYTPPQRLLSPLAGAMGYGVPSALAAQLRRPRAKVVCMVGDGGFLMTGNEMILAVERKLPILFIIANNASYGSIRVHQEKEFPGREVGTALTNPDFVALASAFGMQGRLLDRAEDISDTIREGLAADAPFLIEVKTSLDAILGK